MDNAPGRSERIVTLTEAAHFDLAGIDNATSVIWGEQQAERYIAFLRRTFATLLEEPSLGSPVEDFPGYFLYTASYSKRRNAHGHRILYRVLEDGIRVIRILHTAMNWPAQLDESAE